jgi:hypothetical protein
MDTSEWMPPGFVPLANWDYRSRGKGDGHSPEYKQLREAFRQRKVPGLQTGGDRGRVYVHEQSATQYLIEHLTAEVPDSGCVSETVPPKDPAIAALTAALSSLATTQHSLLVAVERIATAVESIATQPQTPQQELLQRIGGNGFHS